MECFVASGGRAGSVARGCNAKCERRGKRAGVACAAAAGDGLGLTRKPEPYPGDEDLIEELSAKYDLRQVVVEEVVAENEEQEASTEEVEQKPADRDTIKARRMKNYKLKAGEVAVRFTNLPFKKDFIVPSQEGKNLLKLGDSVDIKIPRGCQTGLCGACTVDLEDPSFPEGTQTIRACQTSVMLPEGCDEMVVDCHRMSKDKSGDDFSARDPFSRFDKIDTQYKAAAAPRAWGDRTRIVTCTTCDGTGKHVCPECLGEGHLESSDVACYVCMGRKYVRCADCQGTGERRMR